MAMRLPRPRNILTPRQKTLGIIIVVAAVLILANLPSRPQPAMPAPETAFVTAAASARDAWVGAPNDLAKINMRKTRAQILCRALPGLTAANWFARVDRVEPDALPDFSGKSTARITLSLTDHITLSTPSNPLMNAPSAIVEAGSPIYVTAATLPLGQRVKFSGHFSPSQTDCMAETSFTTDGSMRNPDFRIVLTALAAD
jgi:hypothetical protein